MRLLGHVAASLAIVLGGASTALAGASCGSGVGDAAAVSAVEADTTAQCDCCGPPATNAPCVVQMVKSAMRAGHLSRMCARKVLRDSVRACPIAANGLPCSVCNSDDDCSAGQFCDCRTASCGKAGGVCVTRPEVCSQIAAPVCGCDGMTYANDCERQAAGACKRHEGACVMGGGCVDATGQCTGETCSPEVPCKATNEVCSANCGAPPSAGTCFDLMSRSCTGLACGADAACLSNQVCLAVCPPPAPKGKCFVTVDGQCTDQSCGPDQPCTQPNTFCSPACLGPGGCSSDADCDDHNGCTADTCVNGACQHACLCVGPQGTASCCPGPAALCAPPCGVDANGTCGGQCAPGSSCTSVPGANTCGCVSGVGGPCGGNILNPPPVCAPGLLCQQVNPDITGVCVEPGNGCGAGNMCVGPCKVPCADGTIAVGTCSGGADATAPCACSAQCGPQPTPTEGPCSGDTCAGDCPFICADGTTVVGQCTTLLTPGQPGEPRGPICACIGHCTPPPTPTPNPNGCGSGPDCEGLCKGVCADGSIAQGRCVPLMFNGPLEPGSGSTPPVLGCQCIPDCTSPPPLPHGIVCCECSGSPNACYEIHWVEVTPTCPDGCTTVVDGLCDLTTAACTLPPVKPEM